MKIWFIIKAILYLTGGVAILVMNETALSGVGYVVGTVILAYGVDLIVLSLIRKKYVGENAIFCGALVHLFVGVIMFIVRDDIVKVCLVWAVWSILRESKELTEAVHRMIHRKYGLINAVESVAIIVLSFLMVLEPNIHHAHLHVIILGIELILEILFPIANRVLDGFIARRKAEKEG